MCTIRRERIVLSLVLVSAIFTCVHAAQTTEQRRLCLHFGKRCWAARKANNATAAVLQCAECSTRCHADGTADSLRRAAYCRWVCDEVKCNTLVFSARELQSGKRMVLQRGKRSTTARMNSDVTPSTTSNVSTSVNVNARQTSPSSNTDKKNGTTSQVADQADDESHPWVWLGPVMGAVATVFGAVITVYAVRDVTTPEVRVHPSRVKRPNMPRAPPLLGVNAPRTVPHEYASPYRSNYLWK